MENNKEIIVCAAIDFGTTYSGIAYSYAVEKDVVHVESQWPDGSTLSKVPTAVLFDADKKFVAFGEKAEDKYCELCGNDEQEDFYFFKHFKMALYNDKEIRKDMFLTEENGKKMDALEVFSAAIRFMKDHVISSICQRGEIVFLNVACVRWVLTLPAIWSHSAKVFMRKAAEKAGLPPQDIVIALEPECASIYCNTAPKERMSMSADYKKSGAKYLIVDNGGTIDITAHETLEDGHIKEIYRANGGPWGGKKVDEMFEEFLKKLFSPQSIEKLKTNHPLEWLKLLQEFNAAKNKIKPLDDETSMISVTSAPWNSQFFKNLPSNVKEGVELKGTRLRIRKTIIAKMICDVANHVTCHVSDLLKEKSLKGLDVIMMVGGFSNSVILVDEMKKCVANEIPIVVPEEAHLAVLKGAVLFGWNQDRIICRRSKYTYFSEIGVKFIENEHPERLSFLSRTGCITKKMCTVLQRLVSVNEKIDLNHVVHKPYIPSSDYQQDMQLCLFASAKNDALYSDDEGVEIIGKLKFPMKDVTRAEDRSIKVGYYFGKTEIKVVARDETTGDLYEASFDFIG